MSFLLDTGMLPFTGALVLVAGLLVVELLLSLLGGSLLGDGGDSLDGADAVDSTDGLGGGEFDPELEVADGELSGSALSPESPTGIAGWTGFGEATKAEEAIVTARQVAEAERAKEVALIAARRETEREATRVRLEAEAEKEAAADRAEARREEAQAEADAISIRAEAKKKNLLAEAEGQRAIVAAENALDTTIVEMKVEIARLETMPKLAAELVRPAEKIDSIRIHHLSGLGGPGAAGGEGGSQKAPVNQALDSILGMAVQLPAMKKLGNELGLSLGDGWAAASEKPSGSADDNALPAENTANEDTSERRETRAVEETV